MEEEYPIKTGEVFYRDENNDLWKAVSFQDVNGVVTTTNTLVEINTDPNSLNVLPY